MVRHTSPKPVQYESAAAQKKMVEMSQLGMHVFNPSWYVDYHSGTFTESTLTIAGTQESLTIPVQICTKVADVKNAIALRAMVQPDTLTFVSKQGCYWKQLKDIDEIGRKVTVKGIKSFDPQPHVWPHPRVIIGAGYGGIKNALLYKHEGNDDFIMYERYDRVGGHAWLVQANKTSRLQTDLAAFHVWFGKEWAEGNKKLSFPVDWSTYPKKDEVIAHIQYAAEAYGILPHIKFRTDITSMEIVGKATADERYYVLSGHNTDNKDEKFTQQTSCFYHFPGAYFNPRIINYPGEEGFDGQIGYGMNDDIPFDYLERSRTAILGNGAFAVENVRTCCEYGVEKVYLVTRRKNLASPRLSCWFVHQAIFPVPARMVLNTMIPMYEKCGWGDPWSYWSVIASKDRRQCTISSASRFGIGDVTFLAVATGRCIYIQDLVKRFSRHTLHFESGDKLEGVTNVIKALGLIADWEADRFHKIKEMVGEWPAGDFRRILFVDPLGMHAANFASFSAGLGGYAMSKKNKFLLDFPSEFKMLQATGVIDMLPRMKAEEEKPVHMTTAKYATSVGVLIDASLPRLQAMMAGLEDYCHKCVWAVNPLDKFFDECKDSWDEYQRAWKEDQGYDLPYIEYPYTKEMVNEWFVEYSTFAPISLEAKEAYMAAGEESKASAPADLTQSLEWWKENDERIYELKSKTKRRGGEH